MTAEVGTFVKRVVTVQAVRMTHERMIHKGDWPDWLHDAMARDDQAPGAARFLMGKMYVNCALGPREVPEGFWLIRQEDGTLSPMDDRLFQSTYVAKD